MRAGPHDVTVPPARRTFASRRVTRWALVALVAATAVAGLVDHQQRSVAGVPARPEIVPAGTATPSAPDGTSSG
jgi:hypothetical protein